MPKKTGPRQSRRDYRQEKYHRGKDQKKAKRYDGGDVQVQTDVLGTVCWYDPSKKYGFVDIGTNKDLFIDHRDLRQSGLSELPDGHAVMVDVVERPRTRKETRFCAVNIRIQ